MNSAKVEFLHILVIFHACDLKKNSWICSITALNISSIFLRIKIIMQRGKYMRVVDTYENDTILFHLIALFCL